MPTRFAILHHQQDTGEHCDLMLERGEVLMTWQLPKDPTGAACLPMPAKRIGDHRKAYLEYEGPLSGGRGIVRRVDGGEVSYEKFEPDRIVFRLTGCLLAGRFELSATHGLWQFRVLAGPTSTPDQDSG